MNKVVKAIKIAGKWTIIMGFIGGSYMLYYDGMCKTVKKLNDIMDNL